MRQPEMVPVKVGTYSTMLPVFRDRATSERIVAQLEACHKAVRDKVNVDTVAEVLWVAYEFACQLHEMQEAQEEQDTELVRRLSEVLERVRKAVASYTPPPTGDGPAPSDTAG